MRSIKSGVVKAKSKGRTLVLLFFVHHRPHPPSPSPGGEGAVLQNAMEHLFSTYTLCVIPHPFFVIAH